MNKTVTINISGIIFHIEEEAYEKLSRYLSTIKSYFKDSEGRDEIMTDIESRIAEMLQEKVSQTKQVVLMSDVDHVISVMGKPEEFVDPETASAGHTSASSAETAGDRFTGTRRRVFRDPDNKIVGGVCSGIANYFDFDPVWLRIAWVISLFLGFGFFLYIILWIIIPEARTAAEKLEMRGEPVNINNIHKTVNEEFESLKKNVRNFSDNVSSQGSTGVRRGADKAANFFVNILGNFVKVLAKVVVWAIVVLGVVILIAMLSSAFGVNNVLHINDHGVTQSYSLGEVKDIFFSEPAQHVLIILGLCLVVGVPLVMIIYAALKKALGIRQSYPSIKYVALAFWLAGVGICIYTGIQIGKDFRDTARHRQMAKITQPKTDTLFISLDNSELSQQVEEEYGSNHDREIFRLEKDRIHLGVAKIDLVKSETDSFEVVVVRSARGINDKLASERAANIDYSYTQTDSLIKLSPFYSFDRKDKWRGQTVRVIVKVPVNKMVYLSKDLLPMVRNADIANVKNVWDNHMVGRRWVMTSEGLDCVDCDGLIVDEEGNYRPKHEVHGHSRDTIEGRRNR